MSVPHRDQLAPQSSILQFLKPLAPSTDGASRPRRSSAGGPADGFANIVDAVSIASIAIPSAETGGLNRISSAAGPAGAGATSSAASGVVDSTNATTQHNSAKSPSPHGSKVVIFDVSSDDGEGITLSTDTAGPADCTASPVVVSDGANSGVSSHTALLPARRRRNTNDDDDVVMSPLAVAQAPSTARRRRIIDDDGVDGIVAPVPATAAALPLQVSANARDPDAAQQFEDEVSELTVHCQCTK